MIFRENNISLSNFFLIKYNLLIPKTTNLIAKMTDQLFFLFSLFPCDFLPFFSKLEMEK